ncbi:type II toxin-antitoxin system prevent-host-death family antitoxin [Acinetobacter baumannii]|nr:type II toxin-antitoxin system prevent-host-death family antitoxin [Acinetobacter baumannii]
MERINYANARAQLSRLMDQAIYGQPIEITRKNSESVMLISKSS